MKNSLMNLYDKIMLRKRSVIETVNDERGNYIKTESTKGMVERVSYAKVWGETAKDKSKYLSDLHTKYYNEVGKKYGLERGIPYQELSEEEKWERRHKNSKEGQGAQRA